MTYSDTQSRSVLGQHLRAQRLRTFIGRTAELDIFRSALHAEATSFAVLFVTGPGGIGKSTLLRRLGDEAWAAGRAVVEIDAERCTPDPRAFEAAAADVLTGNRVVLLVDAFEALRPIEGWLRDSFLPRLPAGSLVVLAGRQPPTAAEWSDPGWDQVLRVITLADLPADDAAALLEARGVPAGLRQAVRDFAGGHPLALSLAANAAREQTTGTRWTPPREVIGTLLRRLVGTVPSAAHQQALEICAHVDASNEELLRAVLRADADAGALFAWLRGLPFMSAGPFGLRPHDVVREAVRADLRWRDPQRYAAMHREVCGHLIERIRTATGTSVLGSATSLLYLLRNAGFIPGWFGNSGLGGKVFEDEYRPADRRTVLELASLDGNDESVALTDYWLGRQPEAFDIYRSSDTGEPMGFLAWLRLSVPDEEEIAADPVVAEAWAHVRRTNPLRETEHLGIARFMVTRQPNPSPAGDLISARILSMFVRADRLAWSCLALAHPDAWRQHGYFARLDPPPVVRVGNRPYGLLLRDWRVEPVEELFGWLGDSYPIQDTDEWAGPAKDVKKPSLEVLSRAEFDDAVRSALRSWHHPDLLSANPLIRTRLVADITSANAVTALRTVVSDAVDSLRADHQGEKLHRAVVTTFLQGTPTQEAAAAQLNLPFSTYRRHLTRGLDRVRELLWRREVYGTNLSTE